tara:strand:- start:923 stop:1429 length:507 start_codon:yes stop_codon:yes gene_type:complete
MSLAALKAPIPGQSLTDTPKNYAWERPPELVDPNEAIKYHINRITDGEVIDSILDAIRFGIPVQILSESMMTGAVYKGIHSIDTSLIVEPIVRDFIMKSADMVGVKYEEFIKSDKVSLDERVNALMVDIEETPEEEKDEGYEFLKETVEVIQDQPEEEEKPKGLMARE